LGKKFHITVARGINSRRNSGAETAALSFTNNDTFSEQLGEGRS
jgi:hypothetical protein